MAAARRILIAGCCSPLGMRLAAQLEDDPRVEAIVGVDRRRPREALARTELLALAPGGAGLWEIAQASGVDTVLDVRQAPGGAGGGDHDRPLEEGAARVRRLRKLVLASSDLVYGVRPDRPAFIDEDEEVSDTPASAPVAAARAAERAAAAIRRQTQGELCLTVARLASIVGLPDGDARARLLSLPVIPAVLGSDPRWPLVHARDAAGALVHVTVNDLPGAYNVAADGVLALSEIAAALGRPLAPLLPPWGTLAAAAALRRLGLPIPRELLCELRFGHGLDNRRLKAAGFGYRYTAREALIALREEQRGKRRLAAGGASDDPLAGAQGPAGAAAHYDDLHPDELATVIGSLENAGLELLCAHERSRGARAAVLELLESEMARRRS